MHRTGIDLKTRERRFCTKVMINREVQTIRIQRLWTNQNDSLPAVRPRMVNSTRLPNRIKRENVHQSVYEFTRRSRQESGRTMVSFISSILGGNAINIAECLNTASLLSKETSNSMRL